MPLIKDCYLKYTKSSPYIVENLQLSNYELKEIVKKFDEEERKNDPVPESQYEDVDKSRMLKNVETMLQDEDELLLMKKIYLNSKFINTVLFLANKRENMIEIQRIIDIFKACENIELSEYEQMVANQRHDKNVNAYRLIHIYKQITEK